MEELIHEQGTRIGRYEVLGHAASGGACALYVARVLEPGKRHEVGYRVVLKTCRFAPRSLTSEQQDQFNDRLTREFNLLASLQHPNIIRAYERQSHEGLDFYALELLKGGQPLREWLAQDGQTYGERMDVFMQVTEALAYLHDRGIVVGDLRPASVVVVPPSLVSADAEAQRARAVLVDFSNAQVTGEPPPGPPGRAVGTAEYTSPEYARKVLKGSRKLHRVAPGEDVFHLGVLLYRMLTGRLPTKTAPGQVLELLEEVSQVVPSHPVNRNPEAPRALAELAMACLAKKGSRRPKDGAELIRRLGEALRQDAAVLDKVAPAAKGEDETPLEQMLEATTKAASRKSRVWKSSRFLEEQLRRAAKELRLMRRQMRLVGQTMSIVRASVFAMGGLSIVILALSVALGPLVWQPRPGVSSQAPQNDLESQASSNLPTPEGAVSDVVKGGYKMPDKPESNWLRPTPDGRCILGGVELRGVPIMHEACWDKAAQKDPKVSCPEPLYDAPSDAPAELKDWCFRPFTVKTKNQVFTPMRTGDAGQK